LLLPALLLDSAKSVVFGVEVTCKRPIATKQQWVPSSSTARSIWTPVKNKNKNKNVVKKKIC